VARYDTVHIAAHLAQEPQAAAEKGGRPEFGTLSAQGNASTSVKTPDCKIVLCNGMPRSASTWSFNVCRRLVQELFPQDSLYSGYHENLAEILGSLDGRYDHLVLKCHTLDEKGRELCASGKAFAVYTHRDPFDAIYSSMVMFKVSFDEALASLPTSLRLLEFHRRNPTSYVVPYDRIRNAPLEAISAIARHLRLVVPDELVQRIARETSPDAIAAIADQVSEERGAVRTPRSAYDPETLVHRNHIRNGSSGYGRELLSEEQQERVMKVLAADAGPAEGVPQPLDSHPTPAARKYYSQGGEDCLLWALFGNQRMGFFVDVGAFDGVHLSNSFSFEQQGWRGICVEAHPAFAERCKRNRPGSICLQAACVADEHAGQVQLLVEPLGLLSGIRADETPDLAGRYARRGMKFPGFSTESVPARTLNSILSEHLPAGRSIDFLSIDVEGTELDVLQGIDLERFPVRAILVEANTPAASEQLNRYLASRGYQCARTIDQNLFFAKNLGDVDALKYATVVCQTERTMHPLGPQYTLQEHTGRTINLPPQAKDGLLKKDGGETVYQRPRLSENVLKQNLGQPLHELLQPYIQVAFGPVGSLRRYRFAHIVSPYACPANAEASVTQKTTFVAMARARNFATDKADVDLIAVPDSPAAYVPDLFRKTPALTRTVRDVHQFRVPRNLSLVFDVLEAGIAAASGAEFVIFTNPDICPMPQFYGAVSALLSLGFDCLLINRRTTGKFPMDPRWSDLVPADYGAPHPGFDCFVFPVEFGRRFVRSDACVGAPAVMRSLLYNLVAFSRNMLILTDAHLTYHIGDDRAWDRPELNDYFVFNQQSAVAVLKTLIRDPTAHRRLSSFCLNHDVALDATLFNQSVAPAGPV